MAGHEHPYLKTLRISGLIFFSVLFAVIFLAMFVHSVVGDTPPTPQQAMENTLPTGKVYLRESSAGGEGEAAAQ